MKVTKEQVMQLCEELNKLKRLGDMLANGKDYEDNWLKETVASCELANSVMNNMTSVEDPKGTRTQIAVTLLQSELAYERTRMKPEEQQLTDAVSRSVYLADALLSQLAQTEEEKDRDKIVSEDSRKYWQGGNNELKARITTLEAELKQAKDDEAWARRRDVYLSHLNNVWHAMYVHKDKRVDIAAEGPTIHAALRALRDMVEGGAR